MKLKQLINKQTVIVAGIFITGIFLGWLIFGGNDNGENGAHEHRMENHADKAQVWTCSMHPQIKRDQPGKCPICGMTLIPLNSGEEDSDVAKSPDRIEMTASAMAIADVQTEKIVKQIPYKEVHFPGKIKPDERLIISQTAHIPGRIEKMYVNFTGETVHKGQKLVSLYSPELITAQKEFLEAIRAKNSYPTLYSSARAKLSYWKLTDEQIDDIESSGKVQTNFDLLADYDGIVTKRMVALGDHVMEGAVLFHITDLRHVWVMFDAYEQDIPWVKEGDKINFTVQSLPGRTFTSTVSFIDPVVNPMTRVAYVRTELNNPGNLLKPEMFAGGILKTMLPGSEEALIIPKSAILWTGKRAVVYVKVPAEDKVVFEFREVVLGEDAGDYYVVREGLEEGEEVAVNGVFKIDAAAQLQGKKSMMNPEGGKTSTGHHHGGMKMDGMDMKDGEMNHDTGSGKEEEVVIPDAFIKQTGALVDAYLDVMNALFNDDNKLAAIQAKTMQHTLDLVDMKLLSGEQHMVWMKLEQNLKKNVTAFSGAKDIAEKRKLFSAISDDLIAAFTKLNISLPDREALYVDYCPMANNNQGAYWLNTNKLISNPYTGQAMPECGSIKNTFE